MVRDKEIPVATGITISAFSGVRPTVTTPWKQDSTICISGSQWVSCFCFMIMQHLQKLSQMHWEVELGIQCVVNLHHLQLNNNLN